MMRDPATGTGRRSVPQHAGGSHARHALHQRLEAAGVTPGPRAPAAAPPPETSLSSGYDASSPSGPSPSAEPGTPIGASATTTRPTRGGGGEDGDGRSSLTEGGGTSYYEDWASPSEVLQLQGTFQSILGAYQREVAELRNQLAQSRQEREAYAEDYGVVRRLRETYAEGTAALRARGGQVRQWEEERELMRLQLQKVTVENQRLKLYLEKELGHGGGAGGSRRVVRLPSSSVLHGPEEEGSLPTARPSLPQPVADPTGTSGAKPLPQPQQRGALTPTMATVTAGTGRRPQHQRLSDDSVHHRHLSSGNADDSGHPVLSHDHTLPHVNSSDDQQKQRGRQKPKPQQWRVPVHRQPGPNMGSTPTAALSSSFTTVSLDDGSTSRSPTDQQSNEPFTTATATMATDSQFSTRQDQQQQRTGGASASSISTPSPLQTDDGDGSGSAKSPERPDGPPTSCSSNPLYAHSMGASSRDPSSSLPLPSSTSPSNGYAAQQSDTIPTPTTSPSTATSSSLAYLYQMPRTPAEALREEVRLLEALTLATQRSERLEGRLQYAEALSSMSASQRDQRLLSVAGENERLRRELRHWRDAASTAESRVASALERVEDSDSALEDAQRELRQVRAALTAAESTEQSRLDDCLAEMRGAQARALAQVRAEMQTTVDSAEAARAFLKSDYDAYVAKTGRERDAAAARVHELEAMLAEKCREHSEDLAKHAEDLRAETLKGRRCMDEVEATNAALSTAIAGRAASEAAAAALEEELAHLQELHVTQGECLATVESRLERACEQLLESEARQEHHAALQHRADASAEDLEEQRGHYEAELRTYATAMAALQTQHTKELGRAAMRYEKLSVRFQAVKVQLAAALRPGGWNCGPDAGGGGGGSTGETAGGDGLSGAGGAGIQAAFPLCISPQPICDPLESLRASAAAVAKICHAINRTQT